jgi:hypothetical protein
MGPTSIFLHSRILLVSLLRIPAAWLAMAAQPSPAPGEEEVRPQHFATTIRGIVVDARTHPQAGIIVHCSDLKNTNIVLGEAFSDHNGQFELLIPPGASDRIVCNLTLAIFE